MGGRGEVNITLPANLGISVTIFKSSIYLFIGCGGVITTAPGILLTPGFPNVYAHNLRCNYTLSMDPQHYIILEFDPLNFNMEG